MKLIQDKETLKFGRFATLPCYVSRFTRLIFETPGRYFRLDSLE